ncbi:uncharacterized protein J3D65DRAFT_646186 [Phyllosticta citribraziliensis]|uniref:C2H2 type master regulator of conidiophore development brlA n=1 Tax=Phyllosticta citribraziliensis TaxID=989973 RepID=A0ABR1LKX9_9PEZI
MDGKNSAGRRISLLNEDSRMPSLEPSTYRSRTSSYASSPCLSPQTPQLLRSDSTDSTAMINMPSPVTPTYPYEEAGHSPRPPPGTMPYFAISQQHMVGYHQPKGAMMPFVPPPQPYANHVFVRPPGIERQPMPPANPKTKKNQYPCPLAKAFGCNDYFTTSGHAARHAKKHTGKKDAICPDCKKAFTRKDNMEQHRRTHSNGRNARSAGPKDADDARKKMKPTATRPKPSPIQSSLPPTTSSSLVDPSLPVSPASSSYGVAPAVQPADDYVVSPYAESESASAYPPPEPFQVNPQSGSDDAFRLHTLAFAASGEKRKFEA